MQQESNLQDVYDFKVHPMDVAEDEIGIEELPTGKKCRGCKKGLSVEKDFANRTSLHGYASFMGSNSIGHRLLWGLIIMSSSSILIYFLFWYCDEYINNKPTISSNEKFYLSEMNFPSVTICNSQPLRMNLLKNNYFGLKTLEYLDLYTQLSNRTDYDHEPIQPTELHTCLNNSLSEIQVQQIVYFFATFSYCVEKLMDMDEIESLINDIINDNFPNDVDRTDGMKMELCLNEGMFNKWHKELDLNQILTILPLSKTCNNQLLTNVVDMKDFLLETQYLYYSYHVLAMREYEAYIDENFVNKINLKTYMFEASWNIHDHMLSCSFNSEPCDTSDFRVLQTVSGTCYVFNTDKKQATPGKTGGLRMILNSENYNKFSQYMLKKNADGLQVIIHNEKEPPAENLRFLPLKTGISSNIEIKNRTSTLLDVNSGGNCLKSQKLAAFDEFTSYGCQVNCLLDAIVERCGCQDIDDPRLTDDDGGYWEKGCFTIKKKKCAISIRKNWRSISNCQQCKKPPCIIYDYAPKMSTATLIYKYFRTNIIKFEEGCLKNDSFIAPYNKDLWQITDKTLDDINDKCLTTSNWKENIVEVNVFYRELSQQILIQDVKYSTVDFIGVLGGTMGIYTGMSLMTIIEISEYFFFRISNI
ncbi:hypothetical protein SNEBB_010331 [Seison nebaliae]|nr:hypothetical protein SNEBB_010331 [Seison nebaliae]